MRHYRKLHTSIAVWNGCTNRDVCKSHDKMREKSELRFALLWIAVYVTGNSLTAGFSGVLGMKNFAVAVFHLTASLLLFFWIRENGLMERYGLCKAGLPAGRFLWYIPLIVLSSVNLWNGAATGLSIMDTAFSVCSMAGAGFLEEILFRGFLFRAASRDGVKRGAVISSVSFGLMHIVNLFNGHGMRLAEVIWQIIFATAFGFLCAILFCRGKTLWPCILAHAAFNITAVFAGEAKTVGSVQLLQNTAALALVLGYAWILTKTLPDGCMGAIPSKTES